MAPHVGFETAEFLCCGFSIIHKPGMNVKVLPTKEGQTNTSQHVWLYLYLFPTLLSMIISIYRSKKYPIALTSTLAYPISNLSHCLQYRFWSLVFGTTLPIRQPDGEARQCAQLRRIIRLLCPVMLQNPAMFISFYF